MFKCGMIESIILSHAITNSYWKNSLTNQKYKDKDWQQSLWTMEQQIIYQQKPSDFQLALHILSLPQRTEARTPLLTQHVLTNSTKQEYRSNSISQSKDVVGRSTNTILKLLQQRGSRSQHYQLSAKTKSWRRATHINNYSYQHQDKAKPLTGRWNKAWKYETKLYW